LFDQAIEKLFDRFYFFMALELENNLSWLEKLTERSFF